MLTCQKHVFSLEESVRYLNCAYMSPLLKEVEKAGINGILTKQNPHQITAASFFDTLALLRKSISQLIHNSNTENIAIVPSVSYGLRVAAENIPCKAGQKVVLLKDEFPSNYYAWERLCQEKGLELVIIAPDQDVVDRTLSWNENILAAIDQDTAVVALENVHWQDGTLFNLAAISAKIKSVDAYFVVDGTQSVGIIDINVEELGIDALVCAGYKWLMGPYSIGFAYFSNRLANGKPIEENWVNRVNCTQFRTLTNYSPTYREGAIKYDVGETSNFILVPMFLAAIDQLLAWGVNKLNAYVDQLTQPVLAEFGALGLVPTEPNAISPHLFGVRLPDNINVEQFSQVLAQQNLFVSNRGQYLRISPNIYNTKEDLECFKELVVEQLRSISY